MNKFVETINGIQEVLAICPCCDEIFRLAEGKFIFPQKPTRSCEYSDLVSLEKNLFNVDDRLSAAEEKFKNKLEEQRHQLVEQGRKKAKRKLRKIDPTFSAKNINPQDVKVIFDPVEYVIFHGLNSDEEVDLVEFVSRTPISKTQEIILKSIDSTIQNGNVDFETLHMKDDGTFEIKKAAQR